MKTKPSAFTLIEIMIVVAIIGLLTTPAIPSIKHALTRTQQQACAVNRKNMDGAKLAWALDHRQPPEVVPTEADQFGEQGYLDHKPNCPAGGHYPLNAIREKRICSVFHHLN